MNHPCPALLVLSIFAALAGCGAAQPAPAPAPSVAERAARSTNPVAPAAPPAAAAAPALASAIASAAAPHEPPVMIIHEADLYGQILGRHGATFTISSLLVTSETRPAVGNKATLLCRPEGSTDDTAWVAIADAVIKTPLDANGKIQIKITSDEKKLGGPKGVKPAALVKGARVKITWEW